MNQMIVKYRNKHTRCQEAQSNGKPLTSTDGRPHDRVLPLEPRTNEIEEEVQCLDIHAEEILVEGRFFQFQFSQ